MPIARPSRSGVGLLLLIGALCCTGNSNAKPWTLDIEALRAGLAREYALFDESALHARLARIRPEVERVVGRPIEGPVQIRVVSRRSWVREKVAEALEDSNQSSDEISRMRRRIKLMNAVDVTSRSACGQADGAKGRIDLIADTLLTLAGASPSELLDAVLAHELAHLDLDRRLAGSALLAGSDNAREDLARTAAQEGYAEYVAHRVSDRLGARDPLTLLGFLEKAPRPGSFAEYQTLSETQARDHFVYKAGERFISFLVARFGMKGALDRLAGRPPSSSSQILHPEQYLHPEATASIADRTVERLRRYFGAAGVETTPLPVPAVQLQFATVTRKLQDEALGFFVEALRMEVSGPPGVLHGRKVILDLTRTASAEGAARYLEIVGAAMEGEHDFPAAPRLWLRITSSRTSRFLIDGRPAWGATRQLGGRRAGMGRTLDSLATRFGAMVLQIHCDSFAEGRSPLERMARRLGAVVFDRPAGRQGWAARARQAWAEGRPDPSHVPLLLERLYDPDPDVRVLALRGLAGCGWVKHSGDRPWAALLADPDPEVQAVAVMLAPRPALLTAARAQLGDPARAFAVEVLAKLEQGESRRAHLFAALEDPSAGVRRVAAALLNDGKELVSADPALLARLRSDADPTVRGLALAATAADKRLEQEERARLLLPAVDDSSPAVRAAAWKGLDDLDEVESLPAKALRKGLADDQAGIDTFVNVMIGRWEGLDRNEALKILADGLSRHEGILSMPRIGGLVIGATFMDEAEMQWMVPVIIRVTDRPMAREMGAMALGMMANKAPGAEETLLRWTNDPWARAEAVEAFDKIGARRGVPVYRELLRDWDVDTRAAAARALKASGKTVEGFAALQLEALREGGSQDAAADALAALGQAARPLLPRIEALLQSRSDDTRAAALELASQIEKPTPEALKRVLAFSKDASHTVRVKALEGGKTILEGGASKEDSRALQAALHELLPDIREALDDYEDVQEAALHLLEAAEELDAVTARAIARQLGNEGEGVRDLVSMILEENKTALSQAVPELIDLLVETESLEVVIPVEDLLHSAGAEAEAALRLRAKQDLTEAARERIADTLRTFPAGKG